MTNETPAFAGFHHVSITVRDLDASAQWYSSVLGLRELKRLDRDSWHKVLFVNPASGVPILSLTAHDDGADTAASERNAGLDHLAFAVGTLDDLQRWEAHLMANDVVHSPIAASPSGLGHALVFRDPDNIQLELYASR